MSLLRCGVPENKERHTKRVGSRRFGLLPSVVVCSGCLPLPGVLNNSCLALSRKRSAHLTGRDAREALVTKPRGVRGVADGAAGGKARVRRPFRLHALRRRRRARMPPLRRPRVTARLLLPLAVLLGLARCAAAPSPALAQSHCPPARSKAARVSFAEDLTWGCGRPSAPTPVVFVHQATPRGHGPLAAAVEAALTWNSAVVVVLVSGGGVAAFASAAAALDPRARLLRAHMRADDPLGGSAFDFAARYVHLSGNAREYELISFQRHFILAAAMRLHDLSSVLYADSDVLVLRNASLEAPCYKACYAALCGYGSHSSAHTSFWSLASVTSFTTYVGEMYARHADTLLRSWHAAYVARSGVRNPPGGLCDMTLLHWWATDVAASGRTVCDVCAALPSGACGGARARAPARARFWPACLLACIPPLCSAWRRRPLTPLRRRRRRRVRQQARVPAEAVRVRRDRAALGPGQGRRPAGALQEPPLPGRRQGRHAGVRPADEGDRGQLDTAGWMTERGRALASLLSVSPCGGGVEGLRAVRLVPITDPRFFTATGGAAARCALPLPVFSCSIPDAM